MIWRTFRAEKSNALVSRLAFPVPMVPRAVASAIRARISDSVGAGEEPVLDDAPAPVDFEHQPRRAAERPDHRIEHHREGRQRQGDDGQQPVGKADGPGLRPCSPMTICRHV